MILNLLKYYWYSARAAKKLGFPVNDFVDQGIGLRVRSKKFKYHWHKHFECCKQFILKAFEVLPEVKSVLVLGAGMLNDFPAQQLLAKGYNLYLIDLDPCCEVLWKSLQQQYPGQVEYQISDVSGRLQHWSKLIESGLNEKDLKESLFSVGQTEVTGRKYDLVVSLNILSQLGVFWKDRFHQVFKDRNQDLMAETSALLEKEHLNLLRKCSADYFLIISDRYFHYYKIDQANWQTESATQIDFYSELNKERESEESWLWHLRPAGEEGLDYGEIHHVTAQLCRKA